MKIHHATLRRRQCKQSFIKAKVAKFGFRKRKLFFANVRIRLTRLNNVRMIRILPSRRNRIWIRQAQIQPLLLFI